MDLTSVLIPSFFCYCSFSSPLHSSGQQQDPNIKFSPIKIKLWHTLYFWMCSNYFNESLTDHGNMERGAMRCMLLSYALFCFFSLARARHYLNMTVNKLILSQILSLYHQKETLQNFQDDFSNTTHTIWPICLPKIIVEQGRIYREGAGGEHPPEMKPSSSC